MISLNQHFLGLLEGQWFWTVGSLCHFGFQHGSEQNSANNDGGCDKAGQRAGKYPLFVADKFLESQSH